MLPKAAILSLSSSICNWRRRAIIPCFSKFFKSNWVDIPSANPLRRREEMRRPLRVAVGSISSIFRPCTSLNPTSKLRSRLAAGPSAPWFSQLQAEGDSIIIKKVKICLTKLIFCAIRFFPRGNQMINQSLNLFFDRCRL